MSQTCDDVESALGARIAAVARYAYERSPFYRAHFDAAGVRPEALRTVADIQRLPLTTKQDVAEQGARMWCVPQTEVLDVVTTSGTTGTPLLYPLTAGDIRRLGRSEQLSFECAGITSRDTVLLAVTMDRCFMAGLAYFEGLKAIGATTVRVGSGSPAMLLSLMHRMSATAIVSVPSFLKRVAQYAVQQGMDLTGSTVRNLVCIGEPIREADFTLTPLGRAVSDAWHAQLFSTYAATELASSLCECPAGRGGHMCPEVHYVEVLDEAGRHVRAGQVGEIVTTTLGVEAMPLLRYRTGDCSFLMEDACPCGRRTPRIGPILHRKHQMLKLKGTTVYPSVVQKALDGVAHVRDYVMVVTCSSPLSDELEIILNVDDHASLDLIRERLRGEMKVLPTLRQGTLAEIERLRDSQNYRKKRTFVDRRPGTRHDG